MSSFPPNADLLHLLSPRPAGNLRQIKELAISSMADTASKLLSGSKPLATEHAWYSVDPACLFRLDPARK
jgi:hypothetical protein